MEGDEKILSTKVESPEDNTIDENIINSNNIEDEYVKDDNESSDTYDDSDEEAAQQLELPDEESSLTPKPKKSKTFLKWLKFIGQAILLCVPFYMMDIFLRLRELNNTYFDMSYVPPYLFTLIYVVLLAGLILSFKKKIGTVIYFILWGIFFVLFLVHNIYYSISTMFFNFNMMSVASEGMDYAITAITGAGMYVWLTVVTVLATTYIVRTFAPKIERVFNPIPLLITIAIFVAGHIGIISLIGEEWDGGALRWNSFYNARTQYETCSNSNTSMMISGLYEYTVKNVYVTYLSEDNKLTESEEAILEKAYSEDQNTKTDNKYTGIFKGKNLIIVQMEGLDQWLFNKEDTPTLYRMSQEGINFTDHYSMFTGGGSTFNSEFCVNTGFMTPFSLSTNVYSYSTNVFPYTLPKIFKKMGYSANAIHMNYPSFYQRGENYANWGYDKFVSLKETGDYAEDDYILNLDRELILNETSQKAIFEGDKFFSYIITYTPHTPFTATAPALVAINRNDHIFDGSIPSDISEEKVARIYAGETDYMMELLLEKLKENGHYDDTVIVAFADHYIYTFKDGRFMANYKNTKNNLINHTPFFIWSSDIEHEDVDKTNMQTDILPTFLNMFGVDYHTNYFIGNDIFDESKDGYVVFPDYSWYSDKSYVENGNVIIGDMSMPDVITKSSMINDQIQKNDLTLKSNYFKKHDIYGDNAK